MGRLRIYNKKNSNNTYFVKSCLILSDFLGMLQIVTVLNSNTVVVHHFFNYITPP